MAKCSNRGNFLESRAFPNVGYVPTRVTAEWWGGVQGVRNSGSESGPLYSTEAIFVASLA